MSQALHPIEPADVSRMAHLDRDTLTAQLKLFIFDLLEHDFERLCSLMYRHDVKESLFNAALSLPTDDLRAEAIAILVIDRELAKMATRAAYSKSKNKPSIEE